MRTLKEKMLKVLLGLVREHAIEREGRFMITLTPGNYEEACFKQNSIADMLYALGVDDETFDRRKLESLPDEELWGVEFDAWRCGVERAIVAKLINTEAINEKA